MLDIHNQEVARSRSEMPRHVPLGWVHNTRWYDIITCEYLHTFYNIPPLSIKWNNKIHNHILNLPLIRTTITDKLTLLSRHAHLNPRNINFLSPVLLIIECAHNITCSSAQ